MATDQYERVIVDTNWPGDPRLLKASSILFAAGKGLLAWTGVDVVVDGVKKLVFEVNLKADRSIIIDAVRKASLTVLEVEKVTEEKMYIT